MQYLLTFQASKPYSYTLSHAKVYGVGQYAFFFLMFMKTHNPSEIEMLVLIFQSFRFSNERRRSIELQVSLYRRRRQDAES